MNSYAKAVLWMGVFMIAFGIAHNWSSISSTIFGSNPSGLKVPGPGGIPTSPNNSGKGAGGKCPGPQYYYFNGKCYGSANNLPPSKGGSFT